jgi:hypothetical protein
MSSTVLFPIFIVNVGGSTYGELRVIKIQNLFPHHVSLHYDDSEAGTFLTIIGSNEISKVKASSGMYYNTYKLTTRFRFLIAYFFIRFLTYWSKDIDIVYGQYVVDWSTCAGE